MAEILSEEQQRRLNDDKVLDWTLQLEGEKRRIVSINRSLLELCLKHCFYSTHLTLILQLPLSLNPPPSSLCSPLPSSLLPLSSLLLFLFFPLGAISSLSLFGIFASLILLIMYTDLCSPYLIAFIVYFSCTFSDQNANHQ